MEKPSVGERIEIKAMSWTGNSQPGAASGCWVLLPDQMDTFEGIRAEF